MLKSQDFLILMKLLAHRDRDWNIRQLSQELGLSYANTHAAVGRLRESHLISPRLGPSGPQVKQLLVNAGPYLFPPRYSGRAKGFATSFAAEPLRKKILGGHGSPPVISHPNGDVEGVALVPFDAAVPAAVASDPALRSFVTLFDALRSGRARERALASEYLGEAIDRG